MIARIRKPIAPDVVDGLVAQFRAYRFGGCPTGGAAKLQAHVRKVAQRHGQSFSELWAEVHRLGHEVTSPASA